MSTYNIGDDMKVVDVLDYASGTADRTGAVVDTDGFEGVCFVVKFAAIAAGGTNSIKARHGDVSNGSAITDAADVAGTSQTIADDDDNEVRYIDIKRPLKRYATLYVDKDTTNACAESAVAILYGAAKKPTTKESDVAGESFVSPASGTA